MDTKRQIFTILFSFPDHNVNGQPDQQRRDKPIVSLVKNRNYDEAGFQQDIEE